MTAQLIDVEDHIIAKILARVLLRKVAGLEVLHSEGESRIAISGGPTAENAVRKILLSLQRPN